MTTVVYVAGWARSGSTVIGRILGELDGFFAVGEVVYLWRHLAFAERRCGCGQDVRDCPVWGRIAARVLGVDDGGGAARIHRLAERLLPLRHAPLVWNTGPLQRRSRDLDEYREVLARLYAAIAAETDARVIVDTSKSPIYGMVLDGLRDVDVRVVHLVRDPRAALYSSYRRGPVESPALELALWTAWNAVAEARWHAAPRHTRVRYEDFARSPRETIERILGDLGLGAGQLPFTTPFTVRLGPNHMVDGNDNRFRTGDIEVKLDGEWQRRLPRRARRQALALTWPLLLRHRYPLRAEQL